MNGYLARLTLALLAGAGRMDPSRLEPHRAFLTRRQTDGGGWAGRDGPADPYYTAFALRGLWIAGGLDETIGDRAGDWIRKRMRGSDGVVDFVSLLFAAALLELSLGIEVIGDDDAAGDRVVSVLGELRTDDGGFAKSPEGRAGSTYQTFLCVLCHEILERPVADPDGIERFLSGQRRDDGGYLEIRVAKRSGVNPTAAAVGTLRCIDRLGSIDVMETTRFLAERQNGDGGYSANTRIPFSDLLSTFTASWTRCDLMDTAGVDDAAVDLGNAETGLATSLCAAAKYARSMERPGGGFVGFELDETTDVEYSFYGLATLALASASQSDGVQQ